jgi:hypothetical protein
MDNPASPYNRKIFHALTMQAIADTKIADTKNGIQTPGCIMHCSYSCPSFVIVHYSNYACTVYYRNWATQLGGS